MKSFVAPRVEEARVVPGKREKFVPATPPRNGQADYAAVGVAAEDEVHVEVRKRSAQ